MFFHYLFNYLFLVLSWHEIILSLCRQCHLKEVVESYISSSFGVSIKTVSNVRLQITMHVNALTIKIIQKYSKIVFVIMLFVILIHIIIHKLNSATYTYLHIFLFFFFWIFQNIKHVVLFLSLTTVNLYT